MPFKSQAQRAWMHANHPTMARRWESDTPQGKLPKRVKKAGGGAVGALTTLADLSKYLRYFKASDRKRAERILEFSPEITKQFPQHTLAGALDRGNVAVYRPGKFEELASPLHDPRFESYNTIGEHQDRHVDRLKDIYGYNDVPFLRFSYIPSREEFMYPDIKAKVIGHEGRHRSRAMARRGDPYSVLRVEGGSPWGLEDLILPETPGLRRDMRKGVPAKDVFETEPFAGGGLATAGKEIAQLWKFLKEQKALSPDVKKRFDSMVESAPDLPKLYEQRQLAMGLTNPNTFAYATIDPRHYEHLAYPLEPGGLGWGFGSGKKIDSPITPYGKLGADDRDTIKYLRGLRQKGTPYKEIPFLGLGVSVGDLRQITSHNGRHRMRAMADLGMKDVPLELQQDVARPTKRPFADILRERLDTLELEPQGLHGPDKERRTPIMYRDILTEPFADGGRVEDSDDDSILGLGGLALAAGLLHPAARKLAKRGINAAVRPIQRARSSPVISFETATSGAESMPESLRRRMWAENRADIPSGAKRSAGQGAWMGEQGMEFNPVYMHEMPPSMGGVTKDDDSMRLAAQLGLSLDQAAVPITRVMPSLFDIPEGADALLAQGMSPERLKRLATKMGPETVVSQRPRDEAAIFSLSGEKPTDTMRRAREALPGFAGRYAVSRPGHDRALLTKDDADWADDTYHNVLKRITGKPGLVDKKKQGGLACACHKGE